MRLLSPDFGRSDIVAHLLDQARFDGATFGVVVRRARRPFVTINATDIRRNRSPGADGDLEFVLIDVDFEALADEQEREYLMQIPTRWRLDPDALPRIRAAARSLLTDSPEFRRLLSRLGAAPAR